MLYDPCEDILHLGEDEGLAAEFHGQHKPIPGADFKELLKQVSPVAIMLHGEKNSNLTNASLYRSLGITTVLFAEIRIQEGVVGSLNVYLTDKDQYFAYDDLGKLQEIADLIAQPISTAIMFEENQQLLDHMELACDASIVLNSLQDPRVQLESLLQIVMATTGAERLTYYRYESGEDTNRAILGDQDHQIQHGSLVYESGLGHSLKAIAGLEASRIEVGNEDDFAGWIATNLAPLYISDLRADARFATADPEVRSAFGVPIEHNRDLVGVLLIMSTCENAFDTKQKLFLRRLANLSAVAIRNSKTLLQNRQGYSKLEGKQRILRTLFNSHDLNEMISKFLNELMTQIGAAIGAVWVYNPMEEVFDQLASRGLDSSEIKIPKEDNFLWNLYKLREMYISREFRNDPKVGEKFKYQFPVGIGGVLVPMIVENEFVGIILVGVEYPGEINQAEIDLLVESAISAGCVIQQVLQLDKIKRSLVHARGLQSIDQAVSASMDLRFILKIILDQIIGLLQIDAADVLLLNMHTQTLEFAAGQGFQTAALQQTHLKLGQGRAGKAALERRIIHVPNLDEDLNGFGRAPLLSDECFMAYYGIPLVSKGQVMGVLELFHRVPHESDLEWRRFLETMPLKLLLQLTMLGCLKTCSVPMQS
jgi:GAF domain-containing protein